MAGELNDGATDAGVGGVLRYPVAGFERSEIMQESPSGGGVHRQHRGLVDVDIVGQRDGVFRGQDEFARPSAERQWQHFLTDAQIFHPSA